MKNIKVLALTHLHNYILTLPNIFTLVKYNFYGKQLNTNIDVYTESFFE